MRNDYSFSMWAAFWWGGTFPLYISAFAALLAVVFFVLLLKPSRRYTVLYAVLAFMPLVAGMVSIYSYSASGWREIFTNPQHAGNDVIASYCVPLAVNFGGMLVTLCAMSAGTVLLARSFLREDRAGEGDSHGK